MDFFVALDKKNHKLVNDGRTIQSNVIYIPVGQVALLSLYNMMNVVYLDCDVLVNRSCLTIKKLSFSRTGDIPPPDTCGEIVDIASEMTKILRSRTIRSEPVYQDCCEWTISPANNFALIPTPGFYVLETDDIDQLQDMYVEYAVFDASKAIAIPTAFKLGG